MKWAELFQGHEDQLEDFWGRRGNRPEHVREFAIFGRAVRLTSNDPAPLAAAGYAQPLYSTGPPVEAPPFAIHLIVRSAASPAGPLPENLFDHIQYAGLGDSLFMGLGAWGLCQVDLSEKRATAVLAPELAGRPEMVSRYLLNTILTNFLIASGYGFLHATCLLQGQRTLLLMAPHNSGKSTTALRLALAGYRLLSDSMVFVGGEAADRLYGFPVGRLKLRRDMVADFPQLEPLLEKEPARGEMKFAADLRRLDPELVRESVARPSELRLCLLSLGNEAATRLRPAAPSEVMEAVMANSLFYDSAEIWGQNLARIRPLLERAGAYHLSIGTDPAGILSPIEDLWR